MLVAEIPTLAEFAKEYVKHQTDVKQIRSHERSRVAVIHFIRFYRDKKFSEFTAEDIDIYKQRRLSEGVKPGTIKRELIIIKNLFNCAKKWKRFFGDNPISKAGMPEVHDQRERVLTLEEKNRLVDASPEPFPSETSSKISAGIILILN